MSGRRQACTQHVRRLVHRKMRSLVRVRSGSGSGASSAAAGSAISAVARQRLTGKVESRFTPYTLRVPPRMPVQRSSPAPTEQPRKCRGSCNTCCML